MPESIGEMELMDVLSSFIITMTNSAGAHRGMSFSRQE